MTKISNIDQTWGTNDSQLKHTENFASPIHELTQIDQTLAIQKSLITGLLAAAGLAIGVGIGITLVATKVFAPLGIEPLGLVAVAGTIGGCLALVSGAIGFSVTKFTAS